MDWKGVVMHHSMVLHWSLDGSDLGVPSSAVLPCRRAPPGCSSILRKTWPSPPDLGLYERRICANSDGDDVVVPSPMTESGLPE